MANPKELAVALKKLPCLIAKVCALEKEIADLGGGSTTPPEQLILNNVLNYSALTGVVSPILYQFAYVRESQGTAWLPGGLGGSYYSAGLYMWDGVEWVNSNEDIFEYLDTVQTTLVTLQSNIDALKEEDIQGTATFQTGTGTTNIDLSTASDFYISLSGDLTMTVTNEPSAGFTFVKTFTIKSSSTQTLTLPASWIVIGSYEATGVENYLTVKFSNTATAGLQVLCEIYQA